MELRAIQHALLAGGAASRRVTALTTPTSFFPTRSTILSPASYRATTLLRNPFSTTRQRLQEAAAEATSPDFDHEPNTTSQPAPEAAAPAENPMPQGPMAAYMQLRAEEAAAALTAARTAAAAAAASATAPPTHDRSVFALPQAEAPRASVSHPNDPLYDSWASPKTPPPTSMRRSTTPEDTLAALQLAPADITSYGHTQLRVETPEDVRLRLKPVIGRTVQCGGGTSVDVARGLAILNMKCSANRVRSDARKQLVHERQGLRKKRLRSERWRRNFKLGFQATCTRVEELAKQGW